MPKETNIGTNRPPERSSSGWRKLEFRGLSEHIAYSKRLSIVVDWEPGRFARREWSLVRCYVSVPDFALSNCFQSEGQLKTVLRHMTLLLPFGKLHASRAL